MKMLSLLQSVPLKIEDRELNFEHHPMEKLVDQSRHQKKYNMRPSLGERNHVVKNPSFTPLLLKLAQRRNARGTKSTNQAQRRPNITPPPLDDMA